MWKNAKNAFLSKFLKSQNMPRRKKRDLELDMLLDEFEACEKAKPSTEEGKKEVGIFRNKVVKKLKEKGYGLREVRKLMK